MIALVESTIRLSWTLGVLAASFTLVAVSGNHIGTECQHEAETAEVEVFLAQREEQQFKQNCNSIESNHHLYSSRNADQVSNGPSILFAERARMNGLGTYLLI